MNGLHTRRDGVKTSGQLADMLKVLGIRVRALNYYRFYDVRFQRSQLYTCVQTTFFMAHFSIITVCLNAEREIRRTCESVVEQSFEDFEWIVVDGRSTDETMRILEEFRGKITSLISEKDNGIYDAMNKGLEKATGNYIVFMNGGDTFSSNKVLAKVASAPHADLLYGDIFFNEVGGKCEKFPNKLGPEYLLKKMLSHQAIFYNRELFLKFGVFDTSYRIAADYDLHVRLLKLARVTHYHITEPLAVFDLTGMSSDPKFRAIRKKENHRVRKQYFPKYRISLKCIRQELRGWITSLKQPSHIVKISQD
ncbi:MAG: PGL/p-HBAD biosynthesis glycosyltransferase [Opitutia bacterium UBA7350]|nr:MAG: PGL/p-HBAD biosynthesis glycosyltransferase [Opitutae bacterium UBA7350]